MITLENFYQSKAWCKLMQQIKLDRQNEDGFIVCEHCGKPIVKAYDCIGHHKIPLTEENVNDVCVALNPDNIQLVHHRCHNRIHHKLSYDYYHRDVWLIYGAPLSGKNIYVEEIHEEGDLIVDIDAIWQCVSGCQRYVKPNRLKSVVFGVRDKLIDDIRYRRGKWQRAYIIGGYPLISDRDRMSRELGARCILIDTSKEECLQRLKESADGRDEKLWTKFIDEWFQFHSEPPEVG